MGVGGAYIGFAEGIEGVAVNPASSAVRDAFSVEHVDLDGTVSVVLPGFFAGTDFENRGASASSHGSVYDSFLSTELGGVLQLGDWGVAALTRAQSFRVSASSGAQLSMQIARADVTVARSFFRKQLCIGIGVRAASMLLSGSGGTVGSLLAMGGVGLQAGVLVRPEQQRFRFGAAVRGPVFGSGEISSRAAFDAGGVRAADGFVLPREVALPAEVEAGVAVELGPRPLNPIWREPGEEEAPVRARVESRRRARQAALGRTLAAASAADRPALRAEFSAAEAAIRAVDEAHLDASARSLLAARKARAENAPRARVLVVASVTAAAPVTDGIAISSFLAQRYEPYGQQWTLTPRFGIESEPVTNRLVVRVGGYVEPARFSDATPRQHLTFGGDVKLLPFDLFGLLPDTVWKLALGVDVAPRYTNWALGFGVWH